MSSRSGARPSPVDRSSAGAWACFGRGTPGALSTEKGGPAPLATRASQDRDPSTSGPMMPGSPRDRNVRTPEWFEPGVHVHAHVDQRSNSDTQAHGVSTVGPLVAL